MKANGVSAWRERHDLLGDALVVLPLLLTLALLATLFFRTLPQFENLERVRVRSAYRDFAVKIHERELDSSDYPHAGRKAAGRLSRGTWGFEPKGAKTLVWYREPKSPKVRGVELSPVPSEDYRKAFWLYGGLLLLAVSASTGLGLWRLQRLVRARGEFIRAAAHDLRTPVATLKMLADDAGNTKIAAVAERMRRMVMNLNDFMNLGGKRPAPRREPVDLVPLVREAYESFRRDFEADYSPVEFSGEASLMAIGDSELLLQIFWNLFGNELKYAAPYGRVSVALRRDVDSAIAEFVDNGPGMSARERRRAFDRCYRAASALKSGKGGFGLGLCTSREFVRLMGGSLEVAARGKGSVFTLSMPAFGENSENRKNT